MYQGHHTTLQILLRVNRLRRLERAIHHAGRKAQLVPPQGPTYSNELFITVLRRLCASVLNAELRTRSVARGRALAHCGTEAHSLLIEAYNEAALSERTCEWFQKFKNSDFDVEDKYRNGRPKIYEDAELEELLEENSSQTQKELALILEITQQAVSHCLKSLGIIHNQGNWVPYELKPRDVE
ncbi:Mariner Mos1 transposase [Eumeta japonica]|uniref:Mariner Mos1 transposase n=1 Tax=Eumeta variegata TaxID=151549 RepID=A0A4C1V941_EUMVA|nr:Mariner Mos1 transposase [Eumeta japonica]